MAFPYRLTTSVAAVSLYFGFTGLGLAASPQEVADAITKLMKSSPEAPEIVLGTPSEMDGAVVFKDVVIKKDKTQTNIATLKVTGADLSDAGVFKGETLVAEHVVSNHDKDMIEIGTLEFDNFVFTGKETGNRVDSISLDTIKSTTDGKVQATIGTAAIDLSDYHGDVPYGVDLSVEGVEVDPALAGPGAADGAAQLKALGYDKLNLNFYGTGSLDASGDLTIDELTVAGDDMGAVTLAGVFSGFTDEVIKKMSEPNPPAEDLMAKISLKQASLSYEDSSLAGRVIAMQAKSMGQEPAAFVDQITGALPLMLTMIGNQGFQDKLAAGATAFLKDPKNITISVQPDAPVAIQDLVAVGSTEPQTLPDKLKADVQANVAADDGAAPATNQ